MANIGKSVKLGVFTLAIMNVTAVVSLRGLPAEAEYGVSSAFYYLFAALVFLIPTALVAAELAAMFQDKQGGVFRWVGEAFGKKAGFLAIWLQWIESTIWYPTVLTFGAVAFRRYVVGIESFLYIGRCVVYLLVGDIYFAERVGLGRKSRQDRRSGRNDYSGRSVGRSGDCLFVDGRKIPNGFFGQFLARFIEFR